MRKVNEADLGPLGIHRADLGFGLEIANKFSGILDMVSWSFSPDVN